MDEKAKQEELKQKNLDNEKSEKNNNNLLKTTEIKKSELKENIFSDNTKIHIDMEAARDKAFPENTYIENRPITFQKSIDNKKTENVKFYKYQTKNLKQFKTTQNIYNFILFESIYKKIFLINVYSTSLSSYHISIYNYLTYEKITEIKNAFEDIIKIKHFLDTINRRDLILAFTTKKRWGNGELKIWDFKTCKCLFKFSDYFKENNFDKYEIYPIDASLINVANKNYIIICFCLIHKENKTEYDYIYLFDFSGNKIRIDAGNSHIKSIDKYYDAILKKNFLIIDYGLIASYDFNPSKVYKIYENSAGYNYKITVNLEGKILLIGINYWNKKVRIWNFHTNELLTEYNNLFEKVKGIPISGNAFFWNKYYLIITIDIERHGRGGKRNRDYNKHIKMINLKTENFVKNSITEFVDKDDKEIVFNKINYPKFGECLITEINYNKIILWKEGEVKEEHNGV